jgi:hypothetical protein
MFRQTEYPNVGTTRVFMKVTFLSTSSARCLLQLILAWGIQSTVMPTLDGLHNGWFCQANKSRDDLDFPVEFIEENVRPPKASSRTRISRAITGDGLRACAFSR